MDREALEHGLARRLVDHIDKVGLPRLVDDYWEPLLSQAQEMGLSMNFHVGFLNSPDDLKGAVAAVGPEAARAQAPTRSRSSPARSTARRTADG